MSQGNGKPACRTCGEVRCECLTDLEVEVWPAMMRDPG